MDKYKIINNLTVAYFKVHTVKTLLSNIAIRKSKNWQHSHNVSKKI